MRAILPTVLCALLIAPAASGLGLSADARVEPAARASGLPHPSILVEGDGGFGRPGSGVVGG
ncbi:MAG TPA: hypothetical protein VHH36_05635, partial [Candidatus Thermoplasmatota archaeon]|nr:hypothetical protein [Candidatus Thermoplasmatota archaeon]